MKTIFKCKHIEIRKFPGYFWKINKGIGYIFFHFGKYSIVIYWH
jgi:hypothetical protein